MRGDPAPDLLQRPGKQGWGAGRARQTKGPDLLPGVVPHPALGPGHPVQGVVMKDHQLPVGGELHVQFDAAAPFHRRRKGRQTVFRDGLVLGEQPPVGKALVQKRSPQRGTGPPRCRQKDGQRRQNQNKYHKIQDHRDGVSLSAAGGCPAATLL